MQVQNYLFFDGRCEQALNFYQQTLGAQITQLMRFADAPEEEQGPPEWRDKVMHASLTIGQTALMASDGMPGQSTPMQGFSLALDPATLDEGRRLFDALAQGGQIEMPFGPTFWAKGFGMLRDQFGVPWMVNVEG
ncbi:VOC family protein [Chitiniphilus purpureus]|uniref:VOC family protein n=1 Tax=Chitiniphilus purpureus TaxID=2981137 RepID=A0ABY6DS12_9NEIS|nr:VOC family protein [Chitiniphilus sp. CD1]UXY16256.1 VOC family protein [Chitiniphilus sp. CD1]